MTYIKQFKLVLGEDMRRSLHEAAAISGKSIAEEIRFRLASTFEKMNPAVRNAFWAQCPACCHCWPAAYLPMEARKASRLLGRAVCPQCGNEDGILIAKQTGGIP